MIGGWGSVSSSSLESLASTAGGGGTGIGLAAVESSSILGRLVGRSVDEGGAGRTDAGLGMRAGSSSSELDSSLVDGKSWVGRLVGRMGRRIGGVLNGLVRLPC